MYLLQGFIVVCQWRLCSYKPFFLSGLRIGLMEFVTEPGFICWLTCISFMYFKWLICKVRFSKILRCAASWILSKLHVGRARGYDAFEMKIFPCVSTLWSLHNKNMLQQKISTGYSACTSCAFEFWTAKLKQQHRYGILEVAGNGDGTKMICSEEWHNVS